MRRPSAAVCCALLLLLAAARLPTPTNAQTVRIGPSLPDECSERRRYATAARNGAQVSEARCRGGCRPVQAPRAQQTTPPKLRQRLQCALLRWNFARLAGTHCCRLVAMW